MVQITKVRLPLLIFHGQALIHYRVYINMNMHWELHPEVQRPYPGLMRLQIRIYSHLLQFHSRRLPLPMPPSIMSLPGQRIRQATYPL